MEKIIPSSHRKALSVKISGLRFLGFWSPNPSTPPCIKFLYTFNHIFAIFFCSLYIPSLIGDIIINRNDRTAVLEDVSYLSSTLMVGYKSCKFAIDRSRIAHLVEAVLKPLDIYSSSQDSNIKQLLKVNVLYEFIVDISFGGMICLFDVVIIVKIFFNDTTLLVPGAFPFDTTVSPNHGYAIIIQAIMVNVSLLMIVLMDEFIFSLTRWITVHLSILNCNYQKCCVPDESTIQTYSKKPVYESVDNFLYKLQRCSEDHRNLINLVSEWNSIFSSVMFSEISTSCFMICLTSVQLVMDHENMAVAIKFVLFFGSAALQLLIWCWLGNELTFQSERVSNGLWSCGWEMYLKHHHIKSLMRISMIQSIRPLQLKASKFFVISMETYLSVLKTAYSFFALISAINE